MRAFTHPVKPVRNYFETNVALSPWVYGLSARTPSKNHLALMGSEAAAAYGGCEKKRVFTSHCLEARRAGQAKHQPSPEGLGIHR